MLPLEFVFVNLKTTDISQITSRTVAIVDNLDYRRKKLRSAAIR
jgi:hypothetical protein